MTRDSKCCKSVNGEGFLYGDRQPFGCHLCQQGMKVVYFMGGACSFPPHCNWYCPLSINRKKDDTHYIDEIPIPSPTSIKDTVYQIMQEIRKVDAQGMSLTGGDPLMNSRKVHWAGDIIYGVKEQMGLDFHIHLYTSGNNFSRDIADYLENVGLDDLRFHPAEENFHKIDFALNHSYTVAAEVPVIPSEENHAYLLKLASYLDDIGADFLNLNEFEMCAPNRDSLVSRGYKLKKDHMAAVEGSREYAIRFFEEFSPQSNLKLHFCSVQMKDRIQIRARYIRRAENIKFPFEEVSSVGTLLFLRISGAIQTIQQIYSDLYEISKVPKNMMKIHPTKGFLDLPIFLGENSEFIEDLKEYDVKIGQIETLPFHRHDLQKIVEYTPIFP